MDMLRFGAFIAMRRKVLPLACLAGGGALLVWSLIRRRQKRPWGRTVAAGVLALLAPVAGLVLLVLAVIVAAGVTLG